MRKLFTLFLVLNINIIAFQASINRKILKTEGNNTSTDDSSSSSKKLTNLSYCLCIIGVVSFIFLLIFFLAKISSCCCVKNIVYSKLFKEYEKDGIINNRLLSGIKEVYGTKYIFSFLYDKIFISTKFQKEKIKYLDTCTICMDDFNDKDKIYVTSCEHIYHRKCIENYLNLIKQHLMDKNINEGDLNNYLRCPNCKSYLLSNNKILKENNNKNNKENNNISNSGNNNNNINANNNDLNNKDNDIITINIRRTINKQKARRKKKSTDSNTNLDNRLNNINKNKIEFNKESLSPYLENEASSRKIMWVGKNKKLSSFRVLRTKFK